MGKYIANKAIAFLLESVRGVVSVGHCKHLSTGNFCGRANRSLVVVINFLLFVMQASQSSTPTACQAHTFVVI